MMTEPEKELEIEIIPADEDEEEEIVPGYPGEAVFDEARRAWVVAQLCATANGPIFDTLVKDAKSVTDFLITGAVPSATEKKAKPKLGVVS